MEEYDKFLVATKDCLFFFLLSSPFFWLQGVLSSSYEVINHPVTHDHMHGHSHGGHHHGVDMDHPILALSMTVISISAKEGYEKKVRQSLNENFPFNSF